MDKKKNIIIPFSSGVDSTALVYKALKDYDKYNSIKLVYFRIQNNENKADREQEACNNIVAQFNKLFPNSYIRVVHQITTEVFGHSGISMFSQMPIWLMGLMYSCDYNTDEVWLGYCSNDDALSYIPDIQKIWASYKSISHTIKHPVLKFPLIKSKKSQRAIN